MNKNNLDNTQEEMESEQTEGADSGNENPDELIEEFLESAEEEEEETQGGLSPKELKRINRKYKSLSSLVGFLIVIVGLATFYVWAQGTYYYINAKEDLDPEDEQYIESFDYFHELAESAGEQTQDILGVDVVDFEDDAAVDELSYDLEEETLEEVQEEFIDFIEGDAPYLQKSEGMEEEVDSIVDEINQASANIEQTRENISLYGFLPQEVDEIVMDNNIQRAMTSIEAIKFFTSLRVFSNLDPLIEEFADDINIGTSEARQVMESYSDRGELDIQEFINTCFLNPYEDEDCSQIGDFHTYYDEEIDISNPEIYVELMYFIFEQLEFSTFPKLSIVLNSMSPQADEISFSVDIYTFDEDEDSLRLRDINNPHIFIVSTLVNSIRGSHFISGETISLDTINVNETEVSDGDAEYEVKTSNFNFSVPVQREVERRIYDFVYDN